MAFVLGESFASTALFRLSSAIEINVLESLWRGALQAPKVLWKTLWRNANGSKICMSQEQPKATLMILSMMRHCYGCSPGDAGGIVQIVLNLTEIWNRAVSLRLISAKKMQSPERMQDKSECMRPQGKTWQRWIVVKLNPDHC